MVAAIERGEFIAHLFDQNTVRLVATARRLGVHVLKIDHQGTPNQHIDLCLGPLRRAIELAAREPAAAGAPRRSAPVPGELHGDQPS